MLACATWCSTAVYPWIHCATPFVRLFSTVNNNVRPLRRCEDRKPIQRRPCAKQPLGARRGEGPREFRHRHCRCREGNLQDWGSDCHCEHQCAVNRDIRGPRMAPDGRSICRLGGFIGGYRGAIEHRTRFRHRHLRFWRKRCRREVRPNASQYEARSPAHPVKSLPSDPLA